MSGIAAHWCALVFLPPLLLLVSFALPVAGVVYLLVMPWCVWLMFGDLPVAWGFVVLAYCFSGIRVVYRLMSDLLYFGTVGRHPAVAQGVSMLLDSVAVVYFVNSSWPRDLSAWWGIPLFVAAGIPITLLNRVFVGLFDAIYPAARGHVDPPVMPGRHPSQRR
jgi:hypothetical protein